MSGCGDNEHRSTEQSEAGIWQKMRKHDGRLIRSEGHLGEFTVPILKQYDESLW